MRAFVLSVPRVDAELAADRLWSSGAPAVEERETEHPDIVELWTVLGTGSAAIQGLTVDAPRGWIARSVEIDETMADTWRDHATPIWIGSDLVVVPAWLPEPDTGDALAIRIDPGAAFGMGDHPTTILSLQALRSSVTQGATVLDVGCGSGVLAIAALLSGANRATAIDISPAAVEATRDNAVLNDVAVRLEASTCDLAEIDGEFDLVVANILAPTLVGLAPELQRVTAGTLIISGVLDGLHDHVLDALQPLRVVRTLRRDGWAAVVLRAGRNRP